MLLGVTEARAKVGTIQVTPELVNDPEALKKFQAAQGELTPGAEEPAGGHRELSGPEVQPELPRAAGGSWKARRTASPWRATDYIEAVQTYNTTVRSFPSNLTAKMFSHKVKANFTVENEAAISRPPAVDFGTK